MGLTDSALPVVRTLDRNIAIAGGVVLLHVAGLWALQAGLLRRAAEIVVPVRILTETVAPPEPKVEPPRLPPPAPRRNEPVKQPPRKMERAPPPAPKPQRAIAAPPAPEAPLSVVTPEPAAAPAAAAPAAPAEAGAGASAGAAGTGKVELPSSDASYLQNPAPVYPTISKRLGEQGKVIVRVLIGKDGTPQRAELKRSSGFDRLDRAALDYVMKCRYVPGKVGGEPQAMWYEAPVNFVLE
jgi:protein TonB